MSATTSPIMRALQQLARAVGQPAGAARRTAAQIAVGAIEKLNLSSWLPEEDVLYYLGAAEFHAGSFESAERHLAAVPPESPCVGEALWLRAAILASRLAPAGDPALRTRLLGCYQRLAELRPLCPLVQSVADIQTDQRVAATGGPGSFSMPTTKLGRRYDWQTLVQIAELYAAQGLLVDAAQAYAWSAEVRYPQEWLGTGVLSAWFGVADCNERRGERGPAFRWLAKALALPVDSRQLERIAARLERLSETAPASPPPARPDPAVLARIAGLFLKMEMFDQAFAVYETHALNGEENAVSRGRVLESQATFLFDYRAARGPQTILLGSPLTWARVGEAFRAARERYSQAAPSLPEAAAGIDRCDCELEVLQARATAGL